MKRLGLLIVFLFVSIFSIANNEIDSVLQTLKTPKEKIDYILSVDVNVTAKTDSLLDYGITIARENNLELRLAKCLHSRAANYLSNRKLEEYLVLEKESIDIFEDRNDKEGIADHHYSTAFYTRLMEKDFEKADSLYLLAFREYISSKNIKKQILTFKNRSEFAFEVGKHALSDSLLLEAEKLASSYDDNNLIFSIYNSKLISYARRSLYDSAIVAGNNAALVLEDEPLTLQKGRLNVNLGNLYMITGKYQESIKHFTLADSIFHITKYEKGEIQANGNIANLFLKLSQKEKALKYAKRALDKSKEIGEEDLSILYYRIGNILVGIDSTNFDAQIAYYDSAKVSAIKFNNDRNLINVLNGYSVVYKNKGEYDKALEYTNEAIAIAEPINAKSLFNLYYVKSKILYLTGRYQESINAISKALEIPNKLESDKMNLYQWLADSYSHIGNYKKAFEYQEHAYRVNDSISKSVNFAKISEINEKYQSEKKDAENVLLKKDQEIKDTTITKQNIALIGGSVALGLISILSFFLYRQREKQKQLYQKLEKQRDQIALLNRELNHRVKNNLAFMTSLLEMQGRRTSTKEAKMVLKESENRLKALALVHSNLFNNKENTEINLKNYLGEITDHLQNIFSPLDKDIDIVTHFQDYNLDAEDAMRVGLIVNELVTNSVKHAFSKVKKPKITIETVTNNDGSISLRYRDNGPGISETLITKPEDRNENLGIKLISILERQLEKRVKMIYQ